MKHLYRSRREHKLGGVCYGLAEYFDIDPVLMRLLAVLGIFASAGTAILAYIVAWVIIPEEPYVPPQPPPAGQNQGSQNQNP